MGTELASRFTADEARELTDELRADYGSLQMKISTAWRGRIWLALSYACWQDYLDEEFRDVSLRPPKELEEQVIAELSAAGMSTRGTLRVRLERYQGVRANQSDHVGRELGNPA